MKNTNSTYGTTYHTTNLKDTFATTAVIVASALKGKSDVDVG